MGKNPVQLAIPWPAASLAPNVPVASLIEGPGPRHGPRAWRAAPARPWGARGRGVPATVRRDPGSDPNCKGFGQPRSATL